MIMSLGIKLTFSLCLSPSLQKIVASRISAIALFMQARVILFF
jgi:hypothetical protein